MGTSDKTKKPRVAVPSGLWPGSSPELIAAHERALALVADNDITEFRWSRTLGYSIFFALVLLAACVGLAGVFDSYPGVRLQEDSVARRKYEFYAANKDEFDTVFVGSSQVYRHVDPRLFDQKLAEAGHPIRSFNFGIGGMYIPEILHTIDWILERKPANLKWLMVELRELEPVLSEQNQLTRREINWHTPEETAFMETLVWRSDRPIDEKLDLQLWTLRRGLFRIGNVSLAIPTIEEWLNGSSSNPAPWPRRGHLPIDVELAENPNDPILLNRRKAFLDNPEAYEKNMQAYYDDPSEAEPEPLMVEMAKQLVARIRAAGIEPVFFIGVPSYRKYADIIRLEEQGVLPVLFRYNDPERYPELYDRDKLFEMRHLMQPGAERFTTLLADDFIGYLEKHGAQ